MSKEADKQALKDLREQRRASTSRAREMIKTQNQAIKKIKAQIAEEGKTAPEIAQAVGMPASQVLWYLMALKKYGQVAEGEKDGDYFKYALAG